MIRSVRHAEKLAKEYNAIGTDKERLMFIKEHSDDFKIVLDNDITMVAFHKLNPMDSVQEDAIYDIQLNDFDHYNGWSDSIIELFEFAGIHAESV